MTRRLLALAVICSAAVINSACFEMFQQSTTPKTVNILGGTWSSTTPTGGSLINSCTNFQWTATQQSSTSAAGNFSATCFGVLQLTGTASGAMTGSSITWQASGLANGGGITDCAISLSGTATLEGDQIRIPYTGTTCQAPVSGTEILRKN
jgi:hypothetical protein